MSSTRKVIRAAIIMQSPHDYHERTMTRSIIKQSIKYDMAPQLTQYKTSLQSEQELSNDKTKQKRQPYDQHCIIH